MSVGAAGKIGPVPRVWPRPEPFAPMADPAVLEDLRARLRATRWPDAPGSRPCTAPTPARPSTPATRPTWPPRNAPTASAAPQHTESRAARPTVSDRARTLR
jgi:hypothetical protein